MKKLEDLGMIRKVPKKRNRMLTANAIIIQPLKDEMSRTLPVKVSSH
ncbi:hypothetical protein [Peribacillus simplex]|nr:hypothetical protein [Peribacillus simplex]